ncbi:MAG: hypothetical protein HC894_19025, partial [Microcoleus sp. SM1_3_4]|nr:hypothetical protein [Microcoleus sp. SM1_3_4]
QVNLPSSQLSNSQFPIPNYQFPIPNSQFPIPNSQSVPHRSAPKAIYILWQSVRSGENYYINTMLCTIVV